MITAALWAAPFLALAVCGAYPARGRIRAAVLRARWAWHCRGKPVPGDGDPLEPGSDEWRALIGIVQCWNYPAPPERSRT